MPTSTKYLGFFYVPQIYDMGPPALPPLQRRAGDFSALKNPTASAGFEPVKLGTRGQHASSRPPKPLRLSVIAVVAFFSKCLLRGLAIFMMADNKEQRVCVKFCFLLGSEQPLTENKTSCTLFVLYYQQS
jgi:hypothetical protein